MFYTLDANISTDSPIDMSDDRTYDKDLLFVTIVTTNCFTAQTKSNVQPLRKWKVAWGKQMYLYYLISFGSNNVKIVLVCLLWDVGLWI